MTSNMLLSKNRYVNDSLWLDALSVPLDTSIVAGSYGAADHGDRHVRLGNHVRAKADLGIRRHDWSVTDDVSVANASQFAEARQAHPVPTGPGVHWPHLVTWAMLTHGELKKVGPDESRRSNVLVKARVAYNSMFISNESWKIVSSLDAEYYTSLNAKNFYQYISSAWLGTYLYAQPYPEMEAPQIPHALPAAPSDVEKITELDDILIGRDVVPASDKLKALFRALWSCVDRGKLRDIDSALMHLDVSAMHPVAMVAVLRYTFAVRQDLKNWPLFLSQTHDELHRRGEDAARILRGLDDRSNLLP